MADVNAQIQSDIKRLHDNYQALAWYKKWFFPSSVKKIFTNYSEENLQNPQYVSSLYQALFHQTSNWQRWIFSCLNSWFKIDLHKTLASSKQITNDEQGKTNCETIIQHQNPKDFVEALETNQYTYWTKRPESIIAFSNHQQPSNIISYIRSLDLDGLLTQDKQGEANFNVFINHNNHFEIAEGLSTLKEAELLTDDEQGQANRLALQHHQNPAALAKELCEHHRNKLRQERYISYEKLKLSELEKALNTLEKANLLSENTRKALTDASNPQSLAKALCILKDNGFLNNDKQINTILKIYQTFQHLPEVLSNVFCQLKSLNLLNDDTQGQANYDILLNHKKPLSFAEGLLCLKSRGLLNSDEQIAIYRETLNNYHNPLILAKAICPLAALGLLDNDQQGQKNREAICQNNDLELISKYLTSLHKGTNHQHNFEQLLTHQAILTNRFVLSAFSNIPDRLVTQELFDGLFDLANQNKHIEYLGKDAIIAYLNTFNPKLSKNTDSTIHRSAFFQIPSTSSSSSTAQPQPNFASVPFN